MQQPILGRPVQSNDRDSDSIALLVTTRRGLYLFSSDQRRADWACRGPFLAPCDIHHAAYDPRDGSIWAAANGDGARIYRSLDLGHTWDTMGPPLPCDLVWHVQPGRANEPGVVYAGAMPAALFQSRDGGESWREVQSLSGHETRSEWWPGGGGLCLHTILLPPNRPGRIFVAISVAGVFRSDDNGATWTPKNDGVADFSAEFSADGRVKHPTVHRCVHKLVTHPENSDVLFQQNHLGVFRSNDAGDTWASINHGLPTTFGFPIAIGVGPNPALFVIPQDEETLRTPDRLSVWRSDDLGASWTQATDGLPTGRHNVLREGMAADTCNPTGVYFGTADGTLFGSNNGGSQWHSIIEGLPPVRSVKVAHLGSSTMRRNN